MTREQLKGLQARITVDPAVLAGKPVIRGMRISVEQILTAIAGVLQAELLAEYPGLEPEDIQAALQYAGDLNFISAVSPRAAEGSATGPARR